MIKIVVYRRFYRKFSNFSNFLQFFFSSFLVFGDVFSVQRKVLEGVPGDPGPKNDEFFFWKKCFIRSEKARGPAGDRGKKFEKIRKIFGSTNDRPGRTGPAPAWPGLFRAVNPLQGPYQAMVIL